MDQKLVVVEKKDQRLYDIAEKLTKHIHDVVIEYKVTEEEWISAIEFLTEVGVKNEYILLSDVMGVSVLVNDLAHHHDHEEHVTDHNVEGPLYRANAPLVKTPAQLCTDEAILNSEQPYVMVGQVLSVDGNPIPNAIVDVWQADEKGDYENEDPNQPEYNLRARIETDAKGRYEFKSVLPGGYEIGKGGPTGKFLNRIGRHAWRPAHIHFKIVAENFNELTTMVFIPNDPWIDSDAIGAVKDSLILDLKQVDSVSEQQKYGFNKAFSITEYNFKLIPEVN
ncbi:dioxygenase [Psychrobacillus sp. NPDC096426]|uniref:dioxygenase family protein n=1 Tax=Psychrobacillus sp. NPDC096426 TaxID=3364491 RepID=UPI003806033D